MLHPSISMLTVVNKCLFQTRTAFVASVRLAVPSGFYDLLQSEKSYSLSGQIGTIGDHALKIQCKIATGRLGHCEGTQVK